jgi:hypothetical protein
MDGLPREEVAPPGRNRLPGSLCSMKAAITGGHNWS